jgi:hypothetical protein
MLLASLLCPSVHYNRAVILFATQKTQDEQVSIEMTSLSSKEKLTGLAQILGKLQDSNGDFQSDCWAKLRI